ncbi:MAG: M3 family metallopeptidase [Patescibacteria group bacterium]
MSYSIDPISVAMTAEGVTSLCDRGLAEAARLAGGIRFLRDKDDASLTWDTTFGAFDGISKAVQESIYVPATMMMNHPDEAVRTAAMACEPKVNTFTSALFVDDAIADVLKRAAPLLKALPTDKQKFVDETLRDYKRNGLMLDTAGRETLKQFNEQMTTLGQAFEKNLADATLSIEVEPAQLKGLPETYIVAHPVKENGKVTITTNYPDYIPFMRYAEDRVAAKALQTQALNRAKEKNLKLLDQLIELRNNKAKLLGYATWADYVLEPRMAKSSAVVKTFLEDLHRGIQPARETEFRRMREMAASLGIAADQPIFGSDSAYLEDKVASQQFNLDSQKLSEYFEVRRVLQGILDISSKLYGISFEPIDAAKWHEDAQVFLVKDNDGSPLGRAYLDLYPRENKYKHAAVFPLRETMTLPDGSRELPMAALVCNFPKPGATPALLSHDDVVTFFHEFGHLLHALISKSRLTSFAGTSVSRDFVEAPSQMFEEWAWDKETLALFARHYKTDEMLPDELYASMAAARTFGEAIGTDRQIFLATLDQTYHTREPGFNTTDVLEELHPEFSPFMRIPETHFQASFGHLVGYDAAYYGYQWARSIAFDLLSRFKQEGMLNAKTAADYRQAILEPGGSDDESKLVERFLGRPANAEAYKKYLGIDG